MKGPNQLLLFWRRARVVRAVGDEVGNNPVDVAVDARDVGTHNRVLPLVDVA